MAIKKKKKVPARPSRKASVPEPKIKTQVSAAVVAPPSSESLLLLFFGFVLVSVILLQSNAFQWIIAPSSLTIGHPGVILFLGLVLLFLGFRGLPASPLAFDIPASVACPLMIGVMGIAAFFRLYHMNEPPGCYWDDYAVCIVDPRNVIDLHKFPVTFPIGYREPLYPYVAAAFWWLVPTWKPILVHRLVSALFDLTAVGVYYLLGKEISGKRSVGLLLALLGAMSKPMILQTLCGMGGLTLPLGAALLLLMQAKVLKNPSLTNFILWGGALAFGVYTYLVIRPLVILLPIFTLAWVLWKERDKSSRWDVKLALLVLSLGFFPFFLDKMLVVFHNNPITKLWASNGDVWACIQVAFLLILVYLYRASEGKSRQMVAWGMALLLAGILMYPLAMDPQASLKIQSRSFLPKDPAQWVSAPFVNSILAQIKATLMTFFIGGSDRADMNVVGDPFFDYQASALVLLGLVYTLAKPSWWRVFLVAFAFIGIVPHFMTSDQTSAKLLASLPALLLLAAMAVNQWLVSAFSGAAKTRWLALTAALLLAGFGVWDGRTTFLRVYDNWFNLDREDVRVAKALAPDLQDKRIYYAPPHGYGFISTLTQAVLLDQVPLYVMGQDNVNTIFVTPDQKRQDLAVMIPAREKAAIDLMKKEYPHSQWFPQWMPEQPAGSEPYFYRAIVPAADIPEKPGKTFHFQVVPGKSWLRRFYLTEFGLGRGVIKYEDRNPSLDPVPGDAGGGEGSAEGDWDAPAEGDYLFTSKSSDINQVWVDGKLVVDSQPGGAFKTATGSVHLTQGPHRILFKTYFRNNLRFPEFKVRGKNNNVDETLGVAPVAPAKPGA
jgi:hypothetical protein